jgi:hypothetical protein
MGPSLVHVSYGVYTRSKQLLANEIKLIMGGLSTRKGIPGQ